MHVKRSEFPLVGVGSAPHPSPLLSPTPLGPADSFALSPFPWVVLEFEGTLAVTAGLGVPRR